MENTYVLPFRYDRPEIVNGSGTVKPGDTIVYVFEINNKGSQERISLQKAHMTQLAGSAEPLEILGVRPQNGICTTDSMNKSVFCSINYSFIEDAHFPIEYLVKIGNKTTSSPATSSMFNIETTAGSTQCASYLWINDETKLNPVSWSTPYAALKSGNFFIQIGYKKFYGKEPVDVRSDPGEDKTTLEATWNENGVEMRLFMYFQKIDKGMWNLYEMRTYNGNAQGEWIYYSMPPINDVSSLVGMANYMDERVFLASDGSDAKVYCDKCSINAFTQRKPVVQPSGFSLEFPGVEQSKAIVITNDPMAGYGVNALLKNAQAEIVKEQGSFSYDWSVDNTDIVYLQTDSLKSEGTCLYGISAPCPVNHVDVSGIKPGKATVKLVVRRNPDGFVIAENFFSVTVEAVKPITADDLCIQRGQTLQSGQIGVCCEGLDLVKPEGERTDVMGICMQSCDRDTDCFGGEICQQRSNSFKFVCASGSRGDEAVAQLQTQVEALKSEIDTQKTEQSRLTQIVESIKKFLENFMVIG